MHTIFDAINPLQSHFNGSICLAPMWLNNSQFLNDYSKVANLCSYCVDRCFILWQFARGAKRIAEVGVNQGGTATLMYLASRGVADLHLFDTFEGMPENNEGPKEGTMKGEPRTIKRMIPSALFYKGKIEENKWKPQMSFDLVHIDCDLITPTRAAIKKFIDISKVIIFDDYNTIFPQITEEVNRKFIFKNIFTFAHGQAVVML